MTGLVLCMTLLAAGQAPQVVQNDQMVVVTFPDAEHRQLMDMELRVIEILVTEIKNTGEATNFVFIPFRLSQDEMLMAFNLRAPKERESLRELLAESAVHALIELRLEENVLLLTRYVYGADRHPVQTQGIVHLTRSDGEDATRLRNFALCYFLPSVPKEAISDACRDVQRVAPAIPQAPAPVSTPPVPKAKKSKPRAAWIGGGVLAVVSVPLLFAGVLGGSGAVLHAVISYFTWSALDTKANTLGLRSDSGYRARITQTRNVDFVLSGLGAAVGFGLLGIGALSLLAAGSLAVYGFVG